MSKSLVAEVSDVNLGDAGPAQKRAESTLGKGDGCSGKDDVGP